MERALANFDICKNAGATVSFEVDSKTGRKEVLGYCKHERSRIDIEPTCRICLRCEKNKKEKSKKTPAARARIAKGRLRQKQRKEKGEDWRIQKKGLEYF